MKQHLSELQQIVKRALPPVMVSLMLAGCAGQSADADPSQAKAAHSEKSTPSSSPNARVGYDVSFPQCNQQLPTDAAFAIVGLNNHLAKDPNPCFKDQIAWAKKAKGGVELYALIGNPGSKLASKWPQTGNNKYGNCSGGDNLACDYEYGSMIATQDITEATAEGVDKKPVWLDVEKQFSWFFNAQQRNVATLEGMASTFQKHGMSVGIYSNAESWQAIAGSALPKTSVLRGLPNWLLGAGDEQAAEANCQSAGFTGKVIMAQIADNQHIDRDIRCEAG